MRTLVLSILCCGTIALANPSTVATGSDPQRLGATGPLPLATAQQIYLMTDKPLYRPGETIWFRAWEVDTGLAPIATKHGMTAQLLDPRGGIAVEKRLEAEGGGVHNDIALAPTLAGGRYTLRLRSDLGAVEDRPLTISTYEIPRLKQTLEFAKRGYAPGADVAATLTVMRATGEPARGAKVTGIVVVDGHEVARPDGLVGRTGKLTLRFRLPERIAKGDGLLTAVVRDAGATESIQRRIPIETGVVALAFYPEGGDLIAGLASRVYFSATSPLGEPVDVSGRIVDETGTEVGKLASTFRGRGTFAFTPAPGHQYRAIVDRPATGAAPIALPAARDRGCVLGVPAAAAVRTAEIEATVACTADRAVAVKAYLRGREIGQATGRAGAAAAGLRVPLLASAGQGAVRLTLVDGATQTPLAERLVYRKLGGELRVTIKPDREGYAPRDAVSLAIETRDAAGKPVATELAVAVVDDAVLALADDRSARILARLYLEPEMPGQTIEDPNFYFSRDKAAPAALDLVLGTQGWRRFKVAGQ